jgi:hypothetical protein
MGVRIGGVWHEELPDPGAGTTGTNTGNGTNFASTADYKAAGGTAPAAPATPTTTAPAKTTSTAPAADSPYAHMEYWNQGEQQLQQTAAQQAAYQAYLNKRMELVDMPGVQTEKDKLALAAAQEAYTEKLGNANLTGFLSDGTPTFDRLKWDATNQQWTETATGTMADGTKTLAGQLQDSNLSGMYNGQQTEAASEFARTLAIQQQNADLAARTQRSQEAQAMLTLQSQLRGPRNAFQQQALTQGLNATGLSNSVNAIAGQYTPILGGAEHMAPQAASIGSMVQDMNGQMMAPTGGPQFQAPTGQYQPYAGAAPTGGGAPLTAAELAQGTQDAQQVAQTNAGGAMSTSSAPSGYQPYNAQQAQQQNTASLIGNQQQPNTDINAYTAALPSPNKIVQRNWAQLGTDDKQFLLGAYETGGRSANDVQDAITRGMPQFKAPKYGLVGG